MITARRQKSGVVRGCIIPILTVVGILGGCYLLCLVLFLLNQAAGQT